MSNYNINCVEGEKGKVIYLAHGTNFNELISILKQGKIEMREPFGYTPGVYVTFNTEGDVNPVLWSGDVSIILSIATLDHYDWNGGFSSTGGGFSRQLKKGKYNLIDWYNNYNGNIFQKTEKGEQNEIVFKNDVSADFIQEIWVPENKISTAISLLNTNGLGNYTNLIKPKPYIHNDIKYYSKFCQNDLFPYQIDKQFNKLNSNEKLIYLHKVAVSNMLDNKNNSQQIYQAKNIKDLTQFETVNNLHNLLLNPLDYDFKKLWLSQDKLLAKTNSIQNKLKLYGLGKQALIGDNNSPKPFAMQIDKMALWKSWNDLKGMSSDEAKKQFVELAKQILQEN